MSKEEAISVLEDLKLRLSGAPDSYDSETDVRALEIAIDCIRRCDAIENFMKE